MRIRGQMTVRNELLESGSKDHRSWPTHNYDGLRRCSISISINEPALFRCGYRQQAVFLFLLETRPFQSRNAMTRYKQRHTRRMWARTTSPLLEYALLSKSSPAPCNGASHSTCMISSSHCNHRSSGPTWMTLGRPIWRAHWHRERRCSPLGHGA